MIAIDQATSEIAPSAWSQRPKSSVLASSEEWANQQYGRVNLGDKRLNKRVCAIGAKMAARPEASLPNQMESYSELIGAYRVLNNEAVTMESLLTPHREQTLAEASRVSLVLMVEDTTELDYTAHPNKTGLGKIGNGKVSGLLLHSTLAVIPEGREILGLSHTQVVLRQPMAAQRHHDRAGSPEGQLWETSAKAVGRPPKDVIWVHVSDRGSDIYEYMLACLDQGKHFLIRGYQNRLLWWEERTEPESEESRTLLNYVRSLPAQSEGSYTVKVAAGKKQVAREAQVVLQWTEVMLPVPVRLPAAIRQRGPIPVWVLRVWEPNAPEGAEALEWILLSSLPIKTVEEGHRTVGWYTCRWICEDYHQCLKTGCRVEKSQLDDGEDIKRLLGFHCLIAVRLLQIRQAARHTPELPATIIVEPLMVRVLARRQKKSEMMTIAEFWRAVASLGGHLGRKGDGPPGWRTVWRGWVKLQDLVEGARLALGECN